MAVNKNENDTIKKWLNWIQSVVYYAEDNKKIADLNIVYDYISICVDNIRSIPVTNSFIDDKIESLDEDTLDIETQKQFLENLRFIATQAPTQVPESDDNADDNAQNNNAQNNN